MKLSESRKDALWAAMFTHHLTASGNRYRTYIGEPVIHDAKRLADEAIDLVERCPESTDD